jgi:hypothetical protein
MPGNKIDSSSIFLLFLFYSCSYSFGQAFSGLPLIYFYRSFLFKKAS